MKMTASGMMFKTAVGPDWDYILDRLVSTYYETAKWPALKQRGEAEVRQEMSFYLAHDNEQAGLAQLLKERPERSEALIAWDRDGARAGCILMRIRPEAGSKVAWIYLVYVEPSHRRKGLAKELMARAEAWAREGGASSLMLSVAAREQGTIRLYESAGMSPEKIHLRKWL
ncbi:MAG: GNAT family N-acetyltransferase [Methanomassiliicoccales archaeon]|jgi:GNAT superfamily N-acetyltransferase|nr:GNAT family N-acetyltransferase [Methanomassiliicoccales archaeon]MDD1755257.1 GNAT family N-acetyltransferase [Methanomassiliicoccales archaeon]